MTLILGIETSCDETAAAVVADGVHVRSSAVATQHELHAEFGGVVPEIASRAHLERIIPTLQSALTEAACVFADLDAIAVGNRPGLIGSLLVGVSAAQSLAWSLNKPLIPIDHVQAHLYACALREGGEQRAEGRLTAKATHSSPPPSALRPLPSPLSPFPALGLVVSGGHTSLYRMSSFTQLHRVGRTIDDAVGEAYDKAAVILNAGYPGGPALDSLAQRGDARNVDPLPRSMLDPDSLDFSFSGLKTALLYRVRGIPTGRGRQMTFARSADNLSDAARADLAAAFQHAAVGVLFDKLRRALAHFPDTRAILIGGGVCANSHLRSCAQSFDLPVHLPSPAFCVDNAAMIAGLAHALLPDAQATGLNIPVIATTSL